MYVSAKTGASAGTLCDPHRFVSDAELSSAGLYSVRRWQELRQEGSGPKFYRLGRRCVRYRVGDVLAWLEEHAVNG